ncbi:hypothetical protein M422DRAFT_36061, partial [Sphaerobolus stellatus SS14]
MVYAAFIPVLSCILVWAASHSGVSATPNPNARGGAQEPLRIADQLPLYKFNATVASSCHRWSSKGRKHNDKDDEFKKGKKDKGGEVN